MPDDVKRSACIWPVDIGLLIVAECLGRLWIGNAKRVWKSKRFSNSETVGEASSHRWSSFGDSCAPIVTTSRMRQSALGVCDVYVRFLLSECASNHVRSSPSVGADGTIYVGSDDRKLHAVRPNGTLLWSRATGGMVTSSPAGRGLHPPSALSGASGSAGRARCSPLRSGASRRIDPGRLQTAAPAGKLPGS